MTARRWTIPALLLCVALPWLPVLPAFWVTLANYIGVAAVLVIGLVVLTGVGGMTSFGQASFLGFGAYTTAILTTQAGVSPWLTLPTAMLGGLQGGGSALSGLWRADGPDLPRLRAVSSRGGRR